MKNLTSSNSSKGIFFYILFIIITLFYCIFILRTAFSIDETVYFTLVDDAMISMRYAYHLAEGKGICWNIGEKPIQGYTNFGWVLLMALVHLLPFSISKISLFIMLICLLILLGNVCIIKRITENICPDMWVIPFFASICAAFTFPLVYWSLRGMEVGFLCLIVNVATLMVLRLRETFNLKYLIFFIFLSLVAFLVRFDSNLQFGILTLFAGIQALKHKKITLFIIVIMTAIVIAFIYCLYQFYYFGDILPNSYYLKVTGVSLIERLQTGLTFFIKYALFDVSFYLIIVIFGIFFLGKGIFTPESALLFPLFLIQCIYSIYVGGDFAEDTVGGINRFITQGVCPLIIAISLIVYKLIRHIDLFNLIQIQGKKSIAPLFLIFIGFSTVFLTNGQHWIKWVKLNAPMIGFDTRRTKIGVIINNGTDICARIATHAAGQIPYYSRRPSIDMLGKNDAVIAHDTPSAPFYPGHNKWNYDYSIGQLKPDVISDEWGESPEWLANHTDEYERLPNGIWIRKGSSLVNKENLSKRYQ